MGLYVNKDSKGNNLPAGYQDKIVALKADGAEEVLGNSFVPNMICIVDNGPWAAAGYAFSPQEHDAFLNDGSGRPKTWLTHPNAKEIAK